MNARFLSPRSRTWLPLALAAATLTSTASAGDEEGGYVGTRDEGHTTVVYNFLKYFSWDQYYWCADSQWTWNNNNRVDDMDIAIFAGHGNQWYFVGEDGDGVDLTSVGSGSDGGYGDVDCEFVAFQSCYVVPSPIEVSDWYTNWTQSSGVFEGLHQAIGFHTVSYQSTDQDVTNLFGVYTRWNLGVWSSWFAAINAEARSDEHGSAVMHPSTEDDRYYSFAADPSPTSGSLRIWYQF